jgi:hypothetical protein
MKKLSILLLLLFIATPVWAQTAIKRPLQPRVPQQSTPQPPSTSPTMPLPETAKWNEPGQVFEPNFRNDIVVAPLLKFSQVNDEFAFFAGGRLGWIINSRYVLGLEGHWLVNDVPGPSTRTGLRPDLAMKYGGITLEYIIRPEDVVHFSLSSLFAMGSVEYDFSPARDDDTYWVVEPALNVYLSLTQYLQLGLGVGYRYVSDVDLDVLEGEDLSGVAATLSINFGTYGETLVPNK